MEILELLEQRGAVLTDKHFVYTSGKHGPNYINMDPMFPDTELMLNLGDELAVPFAAVDPGQLTIVGAATGGIPLAVVTANGFADVGTFDSDAIPQSAWADKHETVNGHGSKETEFVFERAGFAAAVRNRQVLIVEDLLNSGSTTKKLIKLVRETGGYVIGVSVVCNRGDQTAETLDVPVLESLADVDFQMFPEDACPLCEAEPKVPIVLDIGHGAKFRKEHPDFDIEYISLLD